MRNNDNWDLSSLFKDNEEWQREAEAYKPSLKMAAEFKGKLKNGDSVFLSALSYLEEIYKRLERIAAYAFLKFAADGSDGENAKLFSLASSLESETAEATSFFESEIIALDDEYIDNALRKAEFKPYKVYLEHMRHQKLHILSEKEEKLLSLFSPVSSSFSDSFNDLNNIDMKFEDVDGKPLSHGLYHKFMLSRDEETRRKAFMNYYKAFDDDKHLIARLYEGSVKKDIFLSKARGYKSTLERALFPDDMPEGVYTSLIEAVHDNIEVLHRYYRLRAELMHKSKLKHYDVYVPMTSYKTDPIKYEDAVSIIKEAVAPLGKEYQAVLIDGLTKESWVDRYERKGKRSGAFSMGGFAGNPYILTNYEDEDISSVFTLIHEGGHSMHSYYSARSNPFMCYSYTIFEAEVASTFNENLLHHYLEANAKSKEEEAYLISKNIDSIVATLFRQTMFAEFELKAHKAAENGEPLTLDKMRSLYRELLEFYFGPIMEFEDVSDLECLRIPHFYRAYYCYRYATGISASIALSERVLNGGDKEREDYLSFLRSGGSRYPLDSLRIAGVDMSTKEPVEMAIKHFDNLLKRLEEIER